MPVSHSLSHVKLSCIGAALARFFRLVKIQQSQSRDVNSLDFD